MGKATLTTTITTITTLTTKITTLESTEAGQAGALKTVNDEIDDIIARLAILDILLKKEEKEFNDIVPKDRKYTKDPFGSFLNEYGISTTNRNLLVVGNYRECVKDANKVAACKNFNDYSSGALKKLRRGF